MSIEVGDVVRWWFGVGREYYSEYFLVIDLGDKERHMTVLDLESGVIDNENWWHVVPLWENPSEGGHWEVAA